MCPLHAEHVLTPVKAILKRPCRALQLIRFPTGFLYSTMQLWLLDEYEGNVVDEKSPFMSRIVDGKMKAWKREREQRRHLGKE